MFDECSDTTARHRPDQQPQEEGGRRSPSVVWPALRSGLRPSLQPGQTTDPTGHHSCRSTGHRSCRRALDHGGRQEDQAHHPAGIAPGHAIASRQVGDRKLIVSQLSALAPCLGEEPDQKIEGACLGGGPTVSVDEPDCHSRAADAGCDGDRDRFRCRG